MGSREWAIVLHYPFGREAVLPFRLELEAEAHLLCQQLQHWCRFRLSYRRVRPKAWGVYRLGMDGSRLRVGEFETRDQAEQFADLERRCQGQALQFEQAGVVTRRPRYLYTVEPAVEKVT